MLNYIKTGNLTFRLLIPDKKMILEIFIEIRGYG